MKIIFKIFFSFIIIYLFLFASSSVFAQETIDQIDHFDSHITINKDTSISVVETINYRTSLKKHGIYRYIPYQYSRNGLGYSARIYDMKITDDQGNKISYIQSTSNGFVTYKIGESDVVFTGEKTYILSYKVKNALQRFEKYDELYWDITGDGWKIPIMSTSAKIISPYAKVTAANCYSGVYGSNDNQCNFTYTEDGMELNYNQQIKYNYNLTIAIALSQSNSLISFPTKTELFIKSILDNFALLLVPLPLIILLILWFKNGRDYEFISKNVFDMNSDQPQKKRGIFASIRTPFVYEPLKITPGEAGLMVDEKVDNRDVVAEIIYLASKKYLKLEKIKKKNFFSKKDYKFVKLKKEDDNLKDYQAYLLKKIFENGDEVKLSDLKGSFYNYFSTVKNMIAKSAVNQKFYVSKPGVARGKYIGISTGLHIIVFIISSFIISNMFIDALMPLITVLLFLSYIFSFIITWNMPQKTAIGTNYMLQARGLRKSIKRGIWREKIKEKNLFIEEVLPYAVALGVVKELSKAMKDLNIQAPDYLDADITKGVLLHHMVNEFSQVTTSAMTYNPSSSSYSSGSSFSGGGFSGGGGGGGGGGSW